MIPGESRHLNILTCMFAKYSPIMLWKTGQQSQRSKSRKPLRKERSGPKEPGASTALSKKNESMVERRKRENRSDDEARERKFADFFRRFERHKAKVQS